ncbi:MAG: fibronectin type III domain-containing protein [Candidatus Pacebacteria bacterium]|nr:fibronectin type III domain-containing protein [Candidatus Paceibacterota bacterium]
MKNFKLRKIITAGIIILVFGLSLRTIAAAPSGSFWFQFFTTTITGSDDTGDGGTGNPSDYNYYYVGKTITLRADVSIGAAQPSNGADLLVNFDKDILSGSTLNGLSAYDNYSYVSNGNHDLNIDNTIGKFNLTGTNLAGNWYTGRRQFVQINFRMLKPTAFNYGSTSTVVSINYTLASTTDSNIARNGIDYMDSKEDFNMIVLADTKKPYAKNPNPVDTATNVTVNSNYLFDVRDSKNGAGDDSGVGTGFVNPPTGGVVNINNGIATSSYTASTTYICTGTWLTLCSGTVNPYSPANISVDTRNWLYDTLYTVQISGHRDTASAAQSQLGDTNGPNVIATTTWTFRTEADTTKPQVSARTPVISATNVSVSSQIIIDIIDIKSTNISGSGIISSTCKINVSSPNRVLKTYTSTSSGVVVSTINYGYRFTITPAPIFQESDVISVSTYECQDIAGNIMNSDNYTFSTTDSSAPYIDSFSPASNNPVSATSSIDFTILDIGTGVDLNNTIVYVKGNYYKNGGGAGSATVASTIPTKFSFSTSTNLSPFVVATTTSTGSGYIVSINNLTFSASESIPVIIFAKDLNGNVMQSYVKSFSIVGDSVVDGSLYCGVDTVWDGSSCISSVSIPNGSTYCGESTSWDGASCVGNNEVVYATSTTSSIVTTVVNTNAVCLIPNINPRLGVVDAFVTQINKNGVLVTWNSGDVGSGEVRYGLSEDNLDKVTSEDTDTLNTYHSVVIDNLVPGRLYYFQPVSKKLNTAVIGKILKMSPVYAVITEGQSPKNNTINNTYVTSCKPVTIIKEIDATDDQSKTQSIDTNTKSNIQNNNSNISSTSNIKSVIKISEIFSKKLIYVLIGFLLILIIIILFIKFIIVHNKSNKILIKTDNTKNMFKSKIFMIATISIIVLALASVFYFGKNLNLFGNLFTEIKRQPENILITGSILNPFTLQGVGGVDLDTSNATVKTAPDGYYAFGSANNFEGIKISHPELQRSVLVDIKDIKSGNNLDLYFDVSMFNTLNTYLNNLSQKKWVKAIESLTDSCKERISVEDLSKDPLIFEENFSTAQILNVSNLDSVSGFYSDACQSKFARVSIVYVKTSDQYKKFILTKEGETWKIVK